MNLEKCPSRPASPSMPKSLKPNIWKMPNPWGFKADIALPCAVQNELTLDDAKKLIGNGVILFGEGANMPITNEAIEYIHLKKILHSPGKASNAGGVATSGWKCPKTASGCNGAVKKLMPNFNRS